MAPNKFEKHIKKQLEEREIQPSADAWNKIKDQLDPSPEANTKGYLWYGIAAGFIGVLLVSLLYFGSNKTAMEAKEQIVVTPNVMRQEQSSENNKEVKIDKDKPLIKGETKLGKTVEMVALKNPDTVKKNRHVVAENEIMIPKNDKIAQKLPEELIDVKIAEVW